MPAFIGNSNLLELKGVKARVDDTFINNATVTVQVEEIGGNPMDGEAWPLTMDYVLGSDGDYRVVLSHTLPFRHGYRYVAVIDADGGENRKGHWEFPFRPTVRQS
jgi:hypothetical protein